MKTIFIIGFFFITILGTLLHFAYDLSKHNKIVGLFGAVNESTWEHIKIAITPFILWSVVDGLFYGWMPNYFFAKLIGVLSIIIIMPLIFYTYTSIVKKPILVIDISSFFITIFLSQLFSYLILNGPEVSYFVGYLSIILLFVIFGFYMVLTIMPIKSKIFKDPITKNYGEKGHSEIISKRKK